MNNINETITNTKNFFSNCDNFQWIDNKLIYQPNNASLLDITLDISIRSEGPVQKGTYLKSHEYLKETPDIWSMISNSVNPEIDKALSSTDTLKSLTELLHCELEAEAYEHNPNDSSFLSDEDPEDQEESFVNLGPWSFSCQTLIKNATNEATSSLLIIGIWSGNSNWHINKIVTKAANLQPILALRDPLSVEEQEPKNQIQKSVVCQKKYNLIDKEILCHTLETTGAAMLPLLAGLAFLVLVTFLGMGTAWLIAGAVIAAVVIGNALYQLNEHRKWVDNMHSILFTTNQEILTEDDNLFDTNRLKLSPNHDSEPMRP